MFRTTKVFEKNGGAPKRASHVRPSSCLYVEKNIELRSQLFTQSLIRQQPQWLPFAESMRKISLRHSRAHH